MSLRLDSPYPSTRCWPSQHLRRLLQDDCHVLQCLGREIPFELAIGVNGRVWVHAGSAYHTVVITNSIVNSESMDDRAVQTMVTRLLQG